MFSVIFHTESNGLMFHRSLAKADGEFDVFALSLGTMMDYTISAAAQLLVLESH